MRLWDYRLIPALPNKMLVAQWRECIAIKRQWEKGTLKHRLVSYVMDYDKSLFYWYTCKVATEMTNRRIKFQRKYFDEIQKFCLEEKEFVAISNYPEHNSRYLKQCYYNLQEKRDREMLTWEEFHEIFRVCNEIIYITK